MSWFDAIGARARLQIVEAQLAERTAALHTAETKLRMRVTDIHEMRERMRGMEKRIAELQGYQNVTTPMLTQAALLTQEQDGLDKGGEAKRHAVYAALIKQFPTASRRDLAMAIELVLYRRGDGVSNL